MATSGISPVQQSFKLNNTSKLSFGNEEKTEKQAPAAVDLSPHPEMYNLNPALRQPAQYKQEKSGVSIYTVLGIAALAGVAYWQRNNIVGFLKQHAGGLYAKPINTVDALENYAKEVRKQVKPVFKQVKIHSEELGTKTMQEALQHVKDIAENFITAAPHGRRPQINVVLKPGCADNVARDIRKALHDSSSLATSGIDFNEIQYVEFVMKDVGKTKDKLMGPRAILYDVGTPRHVDGRASIIKVLYTRIMSLLNSKIPPQI